MLQACVVRGKNRLGVCCVDKKQRRRTREQEVTILLLFLYKSAFSAQLTHIGTHLHTYALTHAHTQGRTHTRMYAHTNTRTHARTHIHTHTWADTDIFTNTGMNCSRIGIGSILIFCMFYLSKIAVWYRYFGIFIGISLISPVIGNGVCISMNPHGVLVSITVSVWVKVYRFNTNIHTHMAL